MSGKVFIKTYGCQMNEYDSSKMYDLLEKNQGLTKTDTPDNADVILLNTCSIRERAQENVFSELGRLKAFKDANPKVIIGVGGCVASQEGEAIRKRAPYVDLVFGPQTLHRLPTMMAALNDGPQIDIQFPTIEKFDNLPAPRAEGVLAYVSIMEGCSKYCTFCVVPYTRGEEVSRPFDDILAEVANLASQGVKEVTLLGQNVNAYRGKTHDNNIANLATVIEYIADIDGIERIRYTTSHPVEFSPALIDVYGRVPKLVSHLHLPVQSGSDRVLAQMKRGHTTLEYKSKIRQLRAIRPDITITSDFIIGFPGETDKDFEDTMNLIQDIGFDHSFSFIYSPRPGTPAAQMADDTPMSVKKERLALLQQRLHQQTETISQAMVGNTYPILVEGHSKDFPGKLKGRTENSRYAYFEGDASLIGRIVNVQMTHAGHHYLQGSWVS
ncbi:MAG: tRNA (N6-isopentenyl adenosine(37)-C2)-methylthiotransferase MiaB [Gammaproteobacteria bacterium]